MDSFKEKIVISQLHRNVEWVWCTCLFVCLFVCLSVRLLFSLSVCQFVSPHKSRCTVLLANLKMCFYAVARVSFSCTGGLIVIDSVALGRVKMLPLSFITEQHLSLTCCRLKLGCPQPGQLLWTRQLANPSIWNIWNNASCCWVFLVLVFCVTWLALSWETSVLSWRWKMARTRRARQRLKTRHFMCCIFNPPSSHPNQATLIWNKQNFPNSSSFPRCTNLNFNFFENQHMTIYYVLEPSTYSEAYTNLYYLRKGISSKKKQNCLFFGRVLQIFWILGTLWRR